MTSQQTSNIAPEGSGGIIIRPIFWVALFLSLGILSSPSFLPSPFPLFPFFLIFIFSLFLLSFLLRKNTKLFWSALLSSVFFSGMALHYLRTEKIQKLPEGNMLLIGRVDSFPIALKSATGENRVRLRMQGKFAKKEEAWHAFDFKLLVSLPQTPVRIKVGDELIARGEILKTGGLRNPGAFDPENYLMREQISARFLVRDPEDFKILSERKGNSFLFYLGEIKAFLKQKITEQIPLPERGVINAMLLGDREEIPWELRDSFSKSGTAHLLAISGLHVGLIAMLFLALGKIFRLPRRGNYLLTILLLISYCLLTGSRASVLRATFMIVFYLFGFIIKRDAELVTSLSWSAIIILILEPLQVLDPGFQLSYLTVFSLGTLGAQWQTLEMGFLVARQKQQPLLSAPKWYSLWIEKIKFYLRNYLGVSFAAWFGILPLIAFYFYLFSPVTILANLVVVPYLWVIMASGFAFLFLSGVHEILSQTLGTALWFFTKILIGISDFFASIPYLHFRVPPPSFFLIAIFYLLLLLYLYKDFFKLSRVRFALVLLFLLNLFLWKKILTPASENLKITFLDVGHGDAALIEFPQRGVLLVDTGGSSAWDTGRLALAPFLWSKGIFHLDSILITHPHYDHFGGLATILKEFSVGTVLDNGDRSVLLYEENFKERNVKRIPLRRGDRIAGAKDTELLILHPSESFFHHPAIKTNDQSVVFQIRYRNIRILMAGDAEQFALDKLAAYGAELKSQFLKVPHHGSDEKEEGENFFLWVSPETAIISTAEKNPYNLPSPATAGFLKALGTKIYQTGITGAVFFETDGSTTTLRTMLENPL